LQFSTNSSHDTTETKNVETDFNDQLPEALPLYAPTPALNSEIQPTPSLHLVLIIPLL
jgi:hypothetical protein